MRDLATCQVFTREGEFLGVVEDVLPAGGNDILVVRREGHEVLIPALKSVVLLIDLEGRRIEVELPQGLREIYES